GSNGRQTAADRGRAGDALPGGEDEARRQRELTASARALACVTDPVSKRLFGELPAGKFQDHPHCIHLVRGQPVTVEREEKTDSEKNSPLVSVIKRMIANKTEPVSSRKPS